MSSNGQDLDSSDLLLILDLEIFRREAELTREDGDAFPDEMAAHSKMLRFQADKLLKNPLAETFLHLKWTLIKRFFYFNVFMYTMFVLSLTTLAVVATSVVKDYR